jgi:hypothetical protein
MVNRSLDSSLGGREKEREKGRKKIPPKKRKGDSVLIDLFQP